MSISRLNRQFDFIDSDLTDKLEVAARLDVLLFDFAVILAIVLLDGALEDEAARARQVLDDLEARIVQLDLLLALEPGDGRFVAVHLALQFVFSVQIALSFLGQLAHESKHLVGLCCIKPV